MRRRESLIVWRGRLDEVRRVLPSAPMDASVGRNRRAGDRGRGDRPGCCVRRPLHGSLRLGQHYRRRHRQEHRRRDETQGVWLDAIVQHLQPWVPTAAFPAGLKPGVVEELGLPGSRDARDGHSRCSFEFEGDDRCSLVACFRVGLPFPGRTTNVIRRTDARTGRVPLTVPAWSGRCPVHCSSGSHITPPRPCSSKC